MEDLTHAMAEVSKELLANGFRVFRCSWGTSLFFSLNDKIGYVQEDGSSGEISWSTVHMPSRDIGTGFVMGDLSYLSIAEAAKATCETICPSGFPDSDRTEAAGRKYHTVNTFLSSKSQSLKLTELFA
jgi:hypothetical protein